MLGNLSAEDSWYLFREILEDLEYRLIPIKRLSSKRQKPIWMTNRALKAVHRRHRAYRKYKNPAYVKAARIAKTLLREARQKFEIKLAQNIKEDRKSFYAYARSRSKSRVNVGSLTDSSNELISEPSSDVTILVFSSRFDFDSIFYKEFDVNPISIFSSGNKLHKSN